MAAIAETRAPRSRFLEFLAVELAPQRIRVNSVLPGVIETSRMDDLGRGEKWAAFVKSTIPLGYPGNGSECAEFILFLVTDRGKWITGQAINVDGGTVWGN